MSIRLKQLLLLLGIALLQVPGEKAAPLLRLLDGVAAVVIQFVKLGTKLAPIGVFALIADALVTVAPDDPAQLGLLLQALGGYFLTLTLALAVQTFVVFPLLLRAVAQVNIIDFFRGLSPAMLVAFSTSSSAAALPVTMEQSRAELRLPDEVTSFVLPLGATLHMNGTAMFLSVAAVFLAQAHELHIELRRHFLADVGIVGDHHIGQEVASKLDVDAHCAASVVGRRTAEPAIDRRRIACAVALQRQIAGAYDGGVGCVNHGQRLIASGGRV